MLYYVISYNIIYRAPGVTNSNNHFLLHAAVHFRERVARPVEPWLAVTLLHPGSERWLAVITWMSRDVATKDWFSWTNLWAPAVRNPSCLLTGVYHSLWNINTLYLCINIWIYIYRMYLCCNYVGVNSLNIPTWCKSWMDHGLFCWC